VRDLPSGTVTFLFTDVEGSTRLLRELGAEGYAGVLAEQRRLLRAAFAAHGGVEVDARGDEFFVAFPTAAGALAAAAMAQEALAGGPLRVRIGVHTGTPLLTDEGYFGADVHRAARLAAAASGGQVVVSSSTRALVSNGLRDLGQHRFKDLAAPERVYQLGNEPFPPLRSLPETNLPVPSTPFLGRTEEVETLVRLLVAEDVRLLSLTGVGGTGKTRLALQAAAEAADSFPGGVVWLPLASVADPTLLLPTVIQTLGATDVSEHQLAAVVADRTGGRLALLLLDNCEHLLPELAAPIATLRELPAVTVLATSRERLQLQGEQVFAVPPLNEGDGVRLFETRAAAVGAPSAPRDQVHELCQRLDELPLALELAAARSVLFSPAQLLERLGQRLDLLKAGRDAEPRQQTLRATIHWSHDLLDENEQRLFRRLSVFSGGCTYEAAETVCDADPDTLQSLLDKSLIRRREVNGHPRYWMLDTLHQFATEQFNAAGETEELRRRHLHYFLTFVAASSGAPDRHFSAPLPEQANIRSAASFAQEHDDLASLAELVWAVRGVWQVRGFAAEYNCWLAAALAGERSLPPLLRARLHRLSAGAAYARRDIASCRSHHRIAESLYRQLGDEDGVIRCRIGLAGLTAYAGDLASARRELEQILAEGRRADDTDIMGAVLIELGRMAIEQADYTAAHAFASETERIVADERVWTPTARITAASTLALAELGLGNQKRALELARRALASAHEQGFSLYVWYGLLHLAEIALARGADEAAATMLAHAQNLTDRFGFTGGRLETKIIQHVTATLPTKLDPNALAAARAEGAAMTTDEAVALALSLT